MAHSGKKEGISSPSAPKAIGPYSPAVRSGAHGEFLFISGQVPIDPATGNLIDGDIAAQTRRVFENIGALLTAGGLAYNNIVRTTVFLADMNDFAAMNETYARFFGEQPPARSTVQAARLPRDARVEIEVVALAGSV